MPATLNFTRPHLLRDESELEAAAARVDALLEFDPPEGTDAYEELEFLTLLIRDYEERQGRWDDASPQEIVEEMAEVHGLSRGELAELLGGRSRLSEFLRGIRDLSKGQALALSDRLGLPLDLLLR